MTTTQLAGLQNVATGNGARIKSNTRRVLFALGLIEVATVPHDGSWLGLTAAGRAALA